jgi:hypothetical protein
VLATNLWATKIRNTEGERKRKGARVDQQGKVMGESATEVSIVLISFACIHSDHKQFGLLFWGADGFKKGEKVNGMYAVEVKFPISLYVAAPPHYPLYTVASSLRFRFWRTRKQRQLQVLTGAQEFGLRDKRSEYYDDKVAELLF